MEDDVHKSLKYEIWNSTDPGNKRLDKAFKETAGRGPIYLFFSVNARCVVPRLGPRSIPNFIVIDSQRAFLRHGRDVDTGTLDRRSPAGTQIG